jgi:hypothetical protein
LKDPTKVNTALNALLRVTANHDATFILDHDESSANLLQELAIVCMDTCYEKTEPVMVDSHHKSKSMNIKVDDESTPTVLSLEKSWKNGILFDCSAAWTPLKHRPKFISLSLPRVHAILVILRNLSFVAANLRPMVQSASIMAILIDCLYLDMTDLVLYAVFTLLNLTPVLDVTGHRLLADKLFLDTSKELHTMGWCGFQFAKKFDDTHQIIVDKMILLEHTHQYVQQIWQMFSALRHIVVSPRTSRSVIMMAMEWMKELLDLPPVTSDLPGMHDIFRTIPSDITQRLIDFLWIPRLGPDSLDYVNPINNLVSRISTLKLFMGYDGTVDSDLRDRALEVILQLLELGVSIPSSPRLYNSLFPCLSTKIGRQDAQTLACNIFKALSQSDSHRDGLTYIQGRLLELASRDTRFAQVVLGSIYT